MPTHTREFLDNIDNFRSSLNEWLKPFEEIENKDTFSNDLLRELLAFVGEIERYKEAKIRNAAHKQRNYYDDLLAAIDSTQKTLDTVFKTYENPLFAGEEAETEKHRSMCSGVLLFMLKKAAALNDLHLANGNELLKWHKENSQHRIELIATHSVKKHFGIEETESAERIEKLTAENLEEANIVNASLNFKDFYSEKTLNRSDLRQAFVDNTSRIYCDYTGRANTRRNEQEKAQRKRSPFPALLKICFETANEPVHDDALKKLVAEANSAKN